MTGDDDDDDDDNSPCCNMDEVFIVNIFNSAMESCFPSVCLELKSTQIRNLNMLNVYM